MAMGDDDEDDDDGDGAMGDEVDNDTQWRVVGGSSLPNTVEVFTNKKSLCIR